MFTEAQQRCPSFLPLWHFKDTVGDTEAELDPTIPSSEPDAGLDCTSGIFLQTIIAE